MVGRLGGKYRGVRSFRSKSFSFFFGGGCFFRLQFDFLYLVSGV